MNIDKAIDSDDIEGVSYSLNELNKWNINLRIWNFNQRVSSTCAHFNGRVKGNYNLLLAL